jgi:DNA polymerase III subunit gamma/tau
VAAAATRPAQAAKPQLAATPQQAAQSQQAATPQQAAEAPTPRTLQPTANDWDAIVNSLALQGPVRQLAAHCLLAGRTPGVVRLRLDADGESFRRPQLEQKLSAALADYFGEPIRLEFLAVAAVAAAPAAGESDVTPARREALAAEQRQRAAEQAIESDPAVRAMREVFGATIKPGSVKPLN